MSRLGVLVNPVAGAGRGARVGAETVDLLRRRGHEVRPVEAGTPSPVRSHAPPHVPARAGLSTDPSTDPLADLDALVVVGGDGTVHAGAQLTAGTGLPLGVVPAGTGNDLAATLGLPRRDVDAAVTAIERALARGARRVDAVCVTSPSLVGAAGSSPAGSSPAGSSPAGTSALVSPRWYAGVLSCGFDAAVSARALTMTRGRGTVRYLAAVAAELGAFAPYGYRLTLDGAVWESAGTLVAVANAPRFGGGIAIAPHARIDDGLLDVVLAGPVSRRTLVSLLPGAYRGRHLRHPAVHVLRTREVLVEAVPARGAPPPAAFADGEPLGPLPLRARVEPGALVVLA